MVMATRRSNLEVIADMLRVKGTKTKVMYGASLSYTQTQKYLRLLEDQQLIEVVQRSDGRREYQATDKGRQFVDLLETVTSLTADAA